MHMIFFTEEPSAEKVLQMIIPKIISQCTFDIYTFQGKKDLLKKLPFRLNGFKSWVSDSYRFIILIDLDDDSCIELKNKMEEIAKKTGLITKSRKRSDGFFHVVNRIAIEELEAWFFGDFDAMLKAYPKLPKTLLAKSKYKNPDKISGGTSENLQRLLNRHGYYKNINYLPKIEVAQKISEYMEPERNRSKSFQVFRDTLKDMVLHV